MKNEVILYDDIKKEWKIATKELPKISAETSLVKVIYSGLCGSDMHKILSPTKHEALVVMGHEIVGIVEESENKELIGKLVVVNPIVNCGVCERCKNGLSQFCGESINIGKNIDGAFAKHIIVKNKSIYSLETLASVAEIGVLVDGVAVVVNALSKLRKTPKSVLIVGDGAIAGIAVGVVKTLYPNASISIEGKNNTDLFKNLYGVMGTDANSMYDLTIETVGRAQESTLNKCISKTDIGGTILVLGVFPNEYYPAIHAREAFYKELSIFGVNSFCVDNERDDFKMAIDIITKNHLLFTPLITHKFSLSEFNEGVKSASNKKESKAIKVVFEP